MNAASTVLHPTVIAHHETPIGHLAIHARFARITRLDIASVQTAALPDDDAGEIETAARPTSAVAAEVALLDEARRQLDDYFARRRFGFDLPLDSSGTPFQEEVWGALTRVPWGTATSYGALATDLRRPLGARAVGGAIRANPLALLVPCHRVLGSGSRLTGYSPGQGVPTKRWLLDHEGIDYVD